MLTERQQVVVAATKILMQAMYVEQPPSPFQVRSGDLVASKLGSSCPD
jgi:hypothetical protein